MCVNDNCNNNPLNSQHSIVVNCDGDMACCSMCQSEYLKQKSIFFDTIIHSDKLFNEYIGG